MSCRGYRIRVFSSMRMGNRDITRGVPNHGPALRSDCMHVAKLHDMEPPSRMSAKKRYGGLRGGPPHAESRVCPSCAHHPCP
eukprot:9475053-Pyramimonas_sp.AAC.1